MTRHTDQNTAIRDQFGKQASAYARLVRNRTDGSFRRFVEALRLTAADRVLDVGCGTGMLALSLADTAGMVTGIDLTPEMLAEAQSLQAELGITNVRWQQGNVLPLPFPDGAFSIVVTKATFHHLADPASVLAQMMRVCEPGGRISVSDLTLDPDKVDFFDQIERLRDPSHLHALPVEDLRGFGPAAGLTEVAFWQSVTPIPLEAILATSFPESGNLQRVRAAYQEDAASGKDRLGLGVHEERGTIVVSYPMTTLVWQRSDH